MKDVEHNSSFLSIPDTESSRCAQVAAPWSSAAAGAAAGAAAAAAHQDFAQDLWRRLVDRIPAEPPCSIIDDTSASPSPISQDLPDGPSGVQTLGSFFRESGFRQSQDDGKSREVVGAATESGGAVETESTRRQLFTEGPAEPSGDATVKVPPGISPETTDLRMEASSEDFLQFNRLLRRHGFGEVPHRVEGGRQILLEVKDLWQVCMEVLHAYGDRGRRLQQALLGERSEERQRSDTRVQDLLRQNAKLQEELSATRRDLSDRDASGQGMGLLSSPARNSSVKDKVAADLSFRTQKAEALARQRERELEKLKSRLEQALAAVKRKETDSPETRIGKKVISKADCAETASLRKQVQSLTFRLEEAEAKLRQAEAVQSRAPKRASLPVQDPPETLPDTSSKSQEVKEALEAEREQRAQLEEQLREVQLRHAAEVRAISSSLQEMQEKADRFQAELRMRHASDSSWQREAAKLRDELVEARKTWKGMDARTLMKRDKELRRLGLDAHALEESTSKADLVHMFLELCRLLKTKDLTGLVSEVGRLVERQPAFQASDEMIQLAQGSSDALKELLGKSDLTPAEVLAEVRDMCARWRERSSVRHQETQACLEETEVMELKQVKRAQADMLRDLSTTLGCSADELPTRVKTLVKRCQEHVSEQRTACKLREDLAEARRAWKAVDTRSLIKRDKELRRLGLDKDAVEESIPKVELVDMFLELCRLVKAKDVSGLLAEVKSLASRPPVSTPPNELIRLAQGSLDAVKELLGKEASPSEALAEVKEMCRRWKAQSSEAQASIEGELAVATAELNKWKGTSEAQAELLEDLASAMGCCKEELPNRAQCLVQKCHEHLAAHRLACKLRDDLAEARKTWKAQSDLEGRRRRLDVQMEEQPKADLVDMFLELRRVVKTLVSEVEMLGSRPNEGAEMIQLAQGSLDALQELHGEVLSPTEVLCKVKEMCARSKRPKEQDEVNPLLRQLTSALGCSNDELPGRVEVLLKKCQEHVAAQHIVGALQKLLCVESISEVLPALKEVLDVAALREKVLERASAQSEKTAGQMDLAAGGA